MKDETVSRVMRAMGKKGGKLGGSSGGKARMDALTPTQRKQLARRGAEARWGKVPSTPISDSQPRKPFDGVEVALKLKRQIEIYQLIEQVKEINYDHWKPLIAYGSSELSTAQRAKSRYLVAHERSREILQRGFIRACKDLKVPEDEWPQFGSAAPVVSMCARIDMAPFLPPPFDVKDSPKRWLKVARKAWLRYCKVCLPKVDKQIQAHTRIVNLGSDGPGTKLLVRQKATRKGGKASPMALRFKWAVLYHRRGFSYGQIAKYHNPNGYKLDRITKVIQAILRDLGLR